jgi:hypothetical protein
MAMKDNHRKRSPRRVMGRHWCGGTLVQDGRRAVRCEECQRVRFLRSDGRPPRIANGTAVHVKSEHFAEECDGVVTMGDYDGGWLYRVRPTRGTAPALARNKDGEYWFWDFEVSSLGRKKG